MVNRGEVWWAKAPSEKRRPYLILSRQVAIGLLRTVIAVPATRTVRGIPTEVALDQDDGMPAPCALSFDNIITLPKSLLTDRICRLGPDRMAEACVALGTATGCR